jgi:MauM/NapG family ferredoxin protein
MPDDSRIDRRRFFRAGLRELLKPLANATSPIERALKELEKMTGESPAPAQSSALPGRAGVMRGVWLRPPGALPEREFRDTCSRCGICVSVCPAQAIKIDSTGIEGNGAPYIVASEMPCVACDGLHCMQNCPSGALSFVPLNEIDMGTAVWHDNLCVRRSGEDCRLCVDQCPIGETAIVIDEWRVKVIEDGCIGCGVCEHACPTEPRSITVKPKSQRDSGTVARG